MSGQAPWKPREGEPLADSVKQFRQSMLQRIFKELSALSPKPPAELKALAEQFEKKVYSNSPDPTAYKKDIENRLNDVKKRRDKQPRPAQPAPGQPPPAGQPLPQAPPQQPVPPPQPAPPQAPPPAAANPEQDLAKQQIQQKAQKFRKNLELLLTINQKERWDMLSRFLNLNLHKYKGVLHKQDSAELDQSTAELEKFMNSFKQHRSAAQAAKGSGQSGGSERATGSSSKSSGAAAALHTKTVSLIKAKMRQPLGAAGELVASNVLQLHGLASLAPSSLCKGRAKEVSQAVQLAADGCTIVAVDDTVSSQSQDTLGKRQAQAGHAWERAVRSAALPLHDAAVQVGPSEFLFKRQRTDGASHELKVCVQHRAMAPCEELTELPLIVSSDDGPPVQHGLAVSALTATITSASPDPKQILEPFLRAVHTVSTAIAAVERELSSLRQQFPAATFTRLDNLSDQALVVVANVNSQTGWEAPGIAVHLPPTYPSSFPPIRPAVYAASPTSQRNPVVQELKARCNTVDASEGLSGILRTWAAVACSTHNK